MTPFGFGEIEIRYQIRKNSIKLNLGENKLLVLDTGYGFLNYTY